MFNRLLPLVCSVLIATQTVFGCPLQKLTYITEQYPPHNFRENGVLQGVSVDLLMEAFKRLNCDIKRNSIQVMPWTRSYNMIQNQTNIMLFGMTRLKQREKLFKWAGPYMSTRVALISKKDANIKIQKPSDLSSYTIGVVQDDVGEKLIKSIGVAQENIKYANNQPETLAKMLVLDRFDLWAAEINGAKWLLTKLGYDIRNFEEVYSFKSAFAFYAMSKNIPDSTVELLQEAIDKVRNEKGPNGRTKLDEIHIKYGLAY